MKVDHSALSVLAIVLWHGRSQQGRVLCRLKAKAAQLEAQLKENEQAITQIERLELKYGMHEAEAEKLRQSLGDCLDGDIPSAAELQAMCEKVPPRPPWSLPTAGSGVSACVLTVCGAGWSVGMRLQMSSALGDVTPCMATSLRGHRVSTAVRKRPSIVQGVWRVKQEHGSALHTAQHGAG